MVSVHSFVAANEDTSAALGQLDQCIRARSIDPSFAYAFYGCSQDDSLIHPFLRRRFPNAVLLGGTSCSGVMDKDRLWGPRSIGLLTIDDHNGNYGVASSTLGPEPSNTAERLVRAALANAGCPGQLPELIWIYQSPGKEEAVMEGLRRVVGDRCPIIGGSSADDAVAGRWRQMATDGLMTNGLVVAVMFPSGGIGYAFQGGYEPAGPIGVVTGVGAAANDLDGKGDGRTLVSIDGRPAAQVYNEWTGHALDGKIECGGNVLLETTMFPIGVEAGTIEGVPQFRLVHPESITSAGALVTFASIEEGCKIYSMRGDKTRLVERAGRVAGEAALMLPGGGEELAGGLIIYCAGCMLAVGDQVGDVAGEIRRSFPDAPFIGCFTFGEQGPIIDRNLHGNLMISALAFGK
ncbi:MAG: FIST C-terminal domain-containing protein [Hyphomicrobiales bacterium]|nr:FIST C-terminal domain-containing protein [Hyphomicrobiales bacterium]